MALQDVVDVQITRASAALTRVGFGTLAFVYDASAAPANRIVKFGDADEVAASTLPAPAKAALTAAFSGDLKPEGVKAIYRLTTGGTPETYVAALTAAQALDEDWYGVTIQSRSHSDIVAVAGWVEARTKLFIAATADSDVTDPLDTDDIASTLLAASYSRTGLIYLATAGTEWPDTAWAGSLLGYDPGSITWAFKRIAGSTGQTFTASQIDALEAKRATRLETIQGLTRAIGGFTSDNGAYIDLIHGLDWLRQRLAEDIFAQLVNNLKIPYTNAGIAIIEAAVRARLQDAVQRNVLADDDGNGGPGWVVTVPDISETDPNDRANRLLRDVKFTARLAGAIHKVIVRGVASV